jgi:predicted transcriptional regulator
MHDARGRSKRKPRYVRLHHWVMDCNAYKALNTVERCALVEIHKRYNGANNGYIHISNREIAERLNVSKNTAGRAIKNLVKLGFVDVTLKGSFSQKTPQATEYRLTEFSCDRSNHEAKKTFMRWSDNRT